MGEARVPGKRAASVGAAAPVPSLPDATSQRSTGSYEELESRWEDAAGADAQFVVACLDGTVSGVEARTGQVVWTLDTGAPLASSSLPSSMQALDLMFIPGIDGKSVYTYDTEGGVQKLALSAQQLVEATPFVAQDNRLVLGAQHTEMFAVDVRSGRTRRIAQSGLGATGAHCASEDREDDGDGGPGQVVLVGRTDYTVQVVDGASGSEHANLSMSHVAVHAGLGVKSGGGGMWRDQRMHTTPLVFTDAQGTFIHIDHETGEPVWRMTFRTPVVSVTLVDGDQIPHSVTPINKRGQYCVHDVCYAPQVGRTSDAGAGGSSGAGRVSTRAPMVYVGALAASRDAHTATLSGLWAADEPGYLHVDPSTLAAGVHSGVWTAILPGDSDSGGGDGGGDASDLLFADMMIDDGSGAGSEQEAGPWTQHPLVVYDDTDHRHTFTVDVRVPVHASRDAMDVAACLPGAAHFPACLMGVWYDTERATDSPDSDLESRPGLLPWGAPPGATPPPGAGEELSTSQLVAMVAARVSHAAGTHTIALLVAMVVTVLAAGRLWGSTRSAVPAPAPVPGDVPGAMFAPPPETRDGGEEGSDGGSERAEGEARDGAEEEAEAEEGERRSHALAASTGAITINPDAVLGRGSHGTIVYEGSFAGRPVAVKRMLADFYDIAEHEVSLMMLSDLHPHVLRYFATQHDSEFVYVALEQCQGSLEDVVTGAMRVPCRGDETATEALVRLLSETARGVAFLHGEDIVHRDLKPQNVLISAGGHAKVADLGLGAQLPGNRSSYDTHAAGTCGWQAPESLEGGRCTRAVDVFALGCVIYHALSGGAHPFGARLSRELNIVQDKPQLGDLPARNRELVRALVAQMIARDPCARPTAAEVVHHPAFWSDRKQLAFLMEASDRIEIEAQDNRNGPLVCALEAHAHAVLGTSWRDRIGDDLAENLTRYRRYDDTSLRDLLRVLRNKKHHYHDLPDNVQASLGELPSGFLHYFTQDRFPLLTLAVYTVIAESEARFETNFREFFPPPLATAQ